MKYVGGKGAGYKKHPKSAKKYHVDSGKKINKGSFYSYGGKYNKGGSWHRASGMAKKSNPVHGYKYVKPSFKKFSTSKGASRVGKRGGYMYPAYYMRPYYGGSSSSSSGYGW